MKVEITNELSGDTYSKSIKKKSITIGRHKDCDVVINEEGISRKHIQIEELDGGTYTITDLGSANGTFINEEKLDPNKPTDFNFFFPAKLGFHIIIALTEDDGRSLGVEAKKEDDAAAFLASQGIKATGASSTRPRPNRTTSTGSSKIQIERSTSKGRSSISGRALKREEAKGKASKKNRKGSRGYLKLLIIAGLAYGYWEYFMKEKIEEAPPAPPVTKTKPKVPAKPKTPPKPKFPADPQLVVANTSKCMDSVGQMVCMIINKSDYNEGAYLLDKTLFISLEAAKGYRTLKGNYRLLDSDKKNLILLGKKSIGLRFSEVLFIRSNYRIGKNTANDYGNYIIGHYAIDNRIMNVINQNKDKIEMVAFVVYQKENNSISIVSNAAIGIKELEALNTQADAQKNRLILKYGFISGHKRDFITVFRKKFIGMK